MEKPTVKDCLSRIYKAKQCTDKSDCHTAITEVRALINQFGYTPALVNRLNSLIKRNEVFDDAHEKGVLEDVVIERGYSLSMGDYTIDNSDNCYNYDGEKQFVVVHPYKKNRGYNTIAGAMRYIENNA